MKFVIRFVPATCVRRGARPALSAALLFSLAFGSTGCATGGGGRHSFGDASLGDAAAHARPDSSKVRREEAERRTRPLDVGWRAPDAPGDHDPKAPALMLEETTPPGAGTVVVPAHPQKQEFMVGLVGGGGGLGGDSYDGYGFLGLHLAAYYSPRVRFDLIGAVVGVSFAGQTVVGQSFRNATELAVDISGRYYLTAPQTFLGVYPIAGVRYGSMTWDFARPVVVTENGVSRTVYDDKVDYFSFYGGAGLSLIQLRHAHVGGNVTAGVRLYGWQTYAGFSNDLFPATGFVQVMVETSYRR